MISKNLPESLIKWSRVLYVGPGHQDKLLCVWLLALPKISENAPAYA